MSRYLEKTYDKRFQEHLVERPEVYKTLVRLARAWKRSGHSRASIRLLWEQARVEDESLGGLNDHFHSRYARLIMAREHDLKGMFFTRQLRSDQPLT